MKEILEKIKVGLNPQKSLAKMDENRNMENGVRGQVMHLNPPMEKEAPKNVRKENNRFVPFLMGKRLPHRFTPTDHAAGLKKMLFHQIQKVGFGALTRFLLVDLPLANGSIVNLPLRSRSLRRHENETLTSCSGASGG